MQFQIPIAPVPKARPRTITKGGKTWTYTPGKTQETEDLIKRLIQKSTLKKLPDDVPLSMEVIFYKQKPKYYKKASRLDDLPIGRPDIDNYGKLLCDALNGVLFDDEQLTTTIFRKRWQEPDKEPCISVKIECDYKECAWLT